MRKTDWEKIKTEYITGDPSIRFLCEKYKINKRTMANRCTEEKWVDQRKKYREKVVKKAVQKAEAPRVKEIANTLARMNSIGAIVDAYLEPERYNKFQVSFGGGGDFDVEEREFEKPDTKAISDLATAAEKVAKVTLMLNDFALEREQIQNELLKHKMEIEKQKLELEKQRVEFERMRLEMEQQKSTADTAREIHVIMTDEMKEWGV